MERKSVQNARFFGHLNRTFRYKFAFLTECCFSVNEIFAHFVTRVIVMLSNRKTYLNSNFIHHLSKVFPLFSDLESRKACAFFGPVIH